MTRIAFVTDNHWDASSRFAECVRVHDWIAEDAEQRECDLTLLGGDTFEAKSTPEERNVVAKWLVRMAEMGPVIGVYGNHDVPGDLDLFNRLDAHHRIYFHDRPAVQLLDGVAVAAVPWPRRARLLAALGRPVSHEESSAVAQDCLRNIFRGLGNDLDKLDGVARIALLHVMIDGARTDHQQPIVGADMAVSLADLSLMRADFYACGHVHAQNEWTMDNGASCLYGGAPYHTSFGEPEPKGYVVIETDGPRVVSWERIETPCAPMLLIGARVDDVECPETGRSLRGIVVDHNPEDAELRGAEIRLRYRVASDERELGAREAEAWRLGWLGRGAAAVKVEPEVIAETRARAPEIAAARDLGSKLAALWQAKGVDMDETRAARLIERAHEIESEVASAA